LSKFHRTVKVRYACFAKRADPIDINDYSGALRALKAIDPLLGGLETISDRYETAAKKALDELATSVAKIPAELEKLGVNPNGIQRFHTQLVNLIKVAKKGDAVRSYSPASDAPLSKARNVLQSLGRAALKSSGAGTQVTDFLNKGVVEPFTSLMRACNDWYTAVRDDVTKINDLLSNAKVNPEPMSSSLTLTKEYESYRRAQREFANQSSELLRTIQHNLIGLPSAGGGFEDCTDVNLCITTAVKAFNEVLKLHLSFGKEWGDFTTKNQAQESGQRSLYARVL
jgi:hypothetical protein